MNFPTCHSARLAVSVATLMLSFVISTSAQQTPPNQQEDVVRTNIELVQSAITVVDKSGHFVEGLQRDQFELRVDGKPRPINFLERITAGTSQERVLTASNDAPATATTTPAPDRVVLGRRVIFFIDDLHMSLDSLNRTRQLLRHFLNNELNSRDSVAVVSASGQIGFLEQFTNNKTVLEAAVDRLQPRPYTAEGYGVGSSTRMTEYMALNIDTSRTTNKVLDFYVEECMKGANTFRKAKFALALIRASCETQVRNSARAVLMQSAQITQNTYNSLESLMRSSARAPGRKLAFFVSDGFLLDAGPHAAAVRDKLEHVIDAAQRAGVVIYSIHAKGLDNNSFLDPANTKPMDGNARLEIAQAGEVQATQDALHALAIDTGGRALRNTNFFEHWVTSALDETSNYYLLAWRPEKEEERSQKFSDVKITVIGRPELTVRAPRGYFHAPPNQVSANETKSPNAKPRTSESEIKDALSDYYPSNSVPTTLALTYLSTPANGLVVTSSMQIEASGVTYGNNGQQPATLRLAGVVLNDKGKIASSFQNQLAVNPPKAGEREGGVFYNHHSPLTPGIYQVRVAVRDEKSARVGSAMQWIVIPDLSKGQLAMSSLLLGGQILDDNKNANGSAQVQLSVDHTFQRSTPLGCWLFIYNAKRDGTGHPHLTVQTAIQRDGRTMLTSPARKIEVAGPDPERIPFGDEIVLRTLAPGRYDLNVTVKDNVAGTSVTESAYFTVR